MSNEPTEAEKLEELIAINTELQKKFVDQKNKLSKAMAANKAFQ
jgi:hypothetical protein